VLAAQDLANSPAVCGGRSGAGLRVGQVRLWIFTPKMSPVLGSGGMGVVLAATRIGPTDTPD
jgi:hypothetical protein